MKFFMKQLYSHHSIIYRNVKTDGGGITIFIISHQSHRRKLFLNLNTYLYVSHNQVILSLRIRKKTHILAQVTIIPKVFITHTHAHKFKLHFHLSKVKQERENNSIKKA